MQMKRLLLYEEYGMIEIENQKHRRKVNMNQKILFTAVGGTDPISSTNCYDEQFYIFADIISRIK